MRTIEEMYPFLLLVEKIPSPPLEALEELEPLEVLEVLGALEPQNYLNHSNLSKPICFFVRPSKQPSLCITEAPRYITGGLLDFFNDFG